MLADAYISSLGYLWFDKTKQAYNYDLEFQLRLRNSDS